MNDDPTTDQSKLLNSGADDRRRQGSVLSHVCEFVAVDAMRFTHSILFYRKVYPAQVFEQRRMFGVDVPISKSVVLNEYISASIAQIRTSVEKGNGRDFRPFFLM